MYVRFARITKNTNIQAGFMNITVFYKVVEKIQDISNNVTWYNLKSKLIGQALMCAHSYSGAQE